VSAPTSAQSDASAVADVAADVRFRHAPQVRSSMLGDASFASFDMKKLSYFSD
jgi:hypothetical protein